MIRVNFWRAVVRFAVNRLETTKKKQREYYKEAFNGKNPTMKCNCDDCWDYAIEHGYVKVERM